MNPLFFFVLVVCGYIVLGFEFARRFQYCLSRESEERGRFFLGTTPEMMRWAIVIVWPGLFYGLFFTKRGRNLRAQWKKREWWR